MNILILMTLLGSAFADSVSLDDLLSDVPYRGTVPCTAIDPKSADQGGGYLNDKVAVYSTPDLTSKVPAPQQLKVTCATGGGDCSCYVMILDKAQGFIQVFDHEKKNRFWVPSDPAKHLDVADVLIDQGGIEFRKPAPAIYSDSSLSQTLTTENINAVPKEIEQKIFLKYPDKTGSLRITAGKIVISHPFETERRKTVALAEMPELKDVDFHVIRKENDRYLVIAPADIQNTGKMSAINIALYAYWITPEKGGFTFTPSKSESLAAHPLSAGLSYKVKESRKINGRAHTRLQVLWRMDRILDRNEDGGGEGVENFLLREIVIPTTDEKGRLNFVLTQQDGC